MCGVLSVAVELHHSRSKFDTVPAVQHFVTDQLNYLITARPTAVNMTNATKTTTDHLQLWTSQQENLNLYIDQLLDFMEEYLQHDLVNNQAIARHGVDSLCQMFGNQKKLTILTHSNTGSLATVGLGTALGIIRQLANNNLLQLVYFTETRPYNHGSRLTAYELAHDRVPHTMICDSMAGLLMRTQSIHAVIVGADRITINGDTANKIGTYQLAILAQHHQIPFFVAAPTTSIDFNRQTGDTIVIEHRPSSEMTTLNGISIAADGKLIIHRSIEPCACLLLRSRRSGVESVLRHYTCSIDHRYRDGTRRIQTG